MGVSARIRRVTKVKDGKKYHSFVVRYNHLGKPRQIWRAELEQAKDAARDACRKTANGQTLAEDVMNNGERLAYVRAKEALSEIAVPIDTVCREYAEAAKLLGSRASIMEASREWLKHHAVELPKISVNDAVEKIKAQSRTDNKSLARQHQLRVLLNRFAGKFGINVDAITPKMIADYLTGLLLADRSKKNHRDVIAYFNRWLVLHGYLAKGTDWLEGVQKYVGRKSGEIVIFTPEELSGLLKKADRRMIPFLTIGAFAGLRHAEIGRLDWSEIELSNKESYIEVREGKGKTKVRRLVPVTRNLKAWLLPYQKNAGRVCPFKNTPKQLVELAAAAKIEWKHNGLRHSCISYRVAQSGDLPRIADESGNSVQVIRTNYLRRVKPAAATEWFAIVPKKRARKRVKSGTKRH